MDYYHEGLNIEIIGKAIGHSSPQSLVGWIQAASEVEARIHLIRSLKQARAPTTTAAPSRVPAAPWCAALQLQPNQKQAGSNISRQAVV